MTTEEWVTGQSSGDGATEPDFTSDFPGKQLVTDVYITTTSRPKEEELVLRDSVVLRAEDGYL